MKGLRNHKSLAATIAVLLIIAIGAIVYVTVSNNKDNKTKTDTSGDQLRRPIIKDPSEVKPGTKVPSTPTSTSSTPPSDATNGTAPKAAESR